MEAATRRGGLLYPMLVIAAIAVIVFSVTGIATMMGWLPNALSGRDPAPGFQQTAPRTDINDYRPAPRAPRTSSEMHNIPPPAGRMEGPAEREPRGD